MAYLKSTTSEKITFLHTEHVFGRKSSAANSSLISDLISRKHCCIQWDGTRWVIKDYSRNGTWINNRKIKANTKAVLKPNDLISLGGDDSNGISYQVINIDRPRSLIYRAHPSLQIIPIEDSNLIPDPMSPDYGLYYCYGRKGWFSQVFNTENNSTTQNEKGPYNYGDEIFHAGNRWTIFLLDQDPASGSPPRQPISSIDDTEFQIRFNKREDDIRINLIAKESEFELEPQAYTSIIAHLINLQQQAKDGWVLFQQLSKSTGKSQEILNLQLFMFHHHLASKLDHCRGVSNVIERNANSVRLGIKNYSLYRDGKLDQSSDYE